MNTADLRLIKRQAWKLYSDANSRFNILIEECAHLQDTIFGKLKQTPRTYLFEEQSGNRKWVADIREDENFYYSLPASERALLNLWNSLGSLVYGLEENQRTHRAAFERFLSQCANTSGVQSDSFFWFACQRGYFVHTAFRFYTRQIEHAHEKIVQGSENDPGALPHPILLRRWNSATYGEFLSTYSRHLNWETQHLISGLLNAAKGAAGYARSDGNKNKYLTHSWTHVPTSTVQTHSIVGNFRSESKKMEFGSIRSAYFYLEQPILFPLLYHECAHLNVPTDDQCSWTDFFGARLEAAETLKQLAKFEPEIENFWDHFTAEVWADAISVVLGGQAYLSALVLQLFGMSGCQYYTQYDLSEDKQSSLESFGGLNKRVYEVPYASMQDDYFWEARLLIAVWLCEKLHVGQPGKTPCTGEWLRSVKLSIDHWYASGSSVFTKEQLSSEHEVYWNYRREINEWAEKVCKECINKHLEDLNARKNITSLYRLNQPEIREVIEEAINGFGRQQFGETDYKIARDVRLEDLAHEVRWHFSEKIIRRIDQDSTSLDQWTDKYASYVRNDGGSAFRVGLEWCLARISLYGDVADMLDGRRGTEEIGQIDLRSAVYKDSLKLSHDDVAELVSWLRRKKYSNYDFDTKPIEWIQHTAAVVHDLLTGMARAFLDYAIDEEIRVGTLSLGVVSPTELRHMPFQAVLTSAQNYFARAAADLNEQVAGIPSAQTRVFNSAFLPLIGDYTFLSYLHGSTPVERDCHPANLLKMLLKPRLVIQVFGVRPLYAFPEKGYKYAKVSLIQFRHRWRWYVLLQRLKTNPAYEDSVLFLSSAWEDAILITWHNTPTEIWRSFKDLDLDVEKNGVDTQSSIASAALLQQKFSPSTAAVAGSSWTDDLRKTQLYGKSVIEVLNERSGRYDYTIVWNCNGCDDAIERFTQIMGVMPTEFWARVGSISTSFENCLIDDANQQGLPLSRYKLVSHVLLNS